jgi:hypothetical protein
VDLSVRNVRLFGNLGDRATRGRNMHIIRVFCISFSTSVGRHKIETQPSWFTYFVILLRRRLIPTVLFSHQCSLPIISIYPISVVFGSNGDVMQPRTPRHGITRSPSLSPTVGQTGRIFPYLPPRRPSHPCHKLQNFSNNSLSSKFQLHHGPST